MANQSNLQQLLQNLAGTHTAAQANVPSSVNNGNPNTVYNLPQNLPSTVAPWVNPPANPKWNTMVAPVNKYELPSIAPFVPNTNGGTGWNGIPTTPPVIPGIPNDPNKGGPDVHIPPGGTIGDPTTGGNLPPSGGGPNGGNHNENGHDSWGMDWIDIGGDRTQFNNMISDRPTETNTVQYGNAANPNGWGGRSQAEINELLGQGLNLGSVGSQLADTALGRALGITQDGTLSIGQVMDYVVPGNVYMSQTGKLNMLALIPGLLKGINPLVGNLVGAAMLNYGSQFLEQDDENLNWWQKMFKRYAQRVKENRAAQRPDQGGGNGDRGSNTGTGRLGDTDFGSGWLERNDGGFGLGGIVDVGAVQDISGQGGGSGGTSGTDYSQDFNRLRDSRGTGRGYSH